MCAGKAAHSMKTLGAKTNQRKSMLTSLITTVRHFPYLHTITKSLLVFPVLLSERYKMETAVPFSLSFPCQLSVVISCDSAFL